MKNKTAYLVAEKKIEIKDSPMPVIGPDDVLVKLKHVGVCGSDVHIFNTPFDLGMDIKLPIVLGHESAGEVVETGANVTNLKTGDLVALEPGVPCGKCEQCMNGKYNLCPNVIFMAAPPFVTGAFSTYVSHPARWSFKIPEGMDTMEGALIEPLCVGMHASTRAGVGIGKKVLIIGSGCIGLMTTEVCKAMGVEHITVADLFDIRLNMAKEVGASHTINSGKVDLVQAAKELTNGEGFDFVFETAGNTKTAALTADLVKRGGRIVMVGNIFGETHFNFFKINDKEADIISVFRYRNIYPTAIETTAAGKTQTKKIVSNVFKFDDIQKAFECALYQKESAVKVVIEMD